MEDSWIRLYANNVQFTDAAFERFEPLIRGPRPKSGWLVLATAAGACGVFVYGLFAEMDWLTAFAALAIPVAPLVVLGLASRGQPVIQEQAYLGAQGLRITHRGGELDVEYVIPLAAITAIDVEAKKFDEGRLGTHRWRQYRFSTTRAGEFPNVLINTMRPLHLLLEDLERFYAQPGARQVEMRLLGTREELGGLADC